MALVHEVYDRGQLVIPRYIRELLGWHKGTKISFHVEGNSVVLKRSDDVLSEMEALAKEANLSEKEVEKMAKEHKKTYSNYLAKRTSAR